MNNISATTSLYAFIAHPAHHSKSPLMHNLSFDKLGIDSVYLAFDVTKDNLKNTIDGFKAMGVKGCNVSMPHKQNIIQYLDEISLASKLTNAVNTVTFKDGKTFGTITDGIGFNTGLKDKNWDIVGKKITMVGAGGGAIAIMVQLAIDGAKEIVVYNRTMKDDVQRIIDNTNKETNCVISYKPLSDLSSLKEDMHSSYLFINATGVGMEPMEDMCVIPDNTYFHDGLKVADIIYQPEKTILLKMAEEYGLEIMNGKRMLLYQGAESFRIWTGKDMPVDDVKKVLGIED